MSTTPAATASDAVARLAGDWVLEPVGSSVQLSHRTLWGLIKVKGRFSGLSGHGQVGPDGTVSGAFVVDAASVDTQNRKRDEHLRSGDFFNVSEHPHITFDARSAVSEGAGWAVDGLLTAGGVAEGVRVPVTVRDLSDDVVTLESELEVDRARHGMTFNHLGMIRGKTRLRIVARFTRDGRQAS